MTRKTKKMVHVEEKFSQPLEKLLPEMVTEQGLLKLGINVRRVALAPGESLEVKRVG